MPSILSHSALSNHIISGHVGKHRGLEPSQKKVFPEQKLTKAKADALTALKRDSLTFCCLLLPMPLWVLLCSLGRRGHGRNAHVVVDGELRAVKHLGPGESVVGHGCLAPALDLVAERAARVDGWFKADGREQRTQEELRVGGALDVDERHPRGRLLRHLRHRVMIQQVGQPHLRVADVCAQTEISGDVDAERACVLVLLGDGAPVGEVGADAAAEVQGEVQEKLPHGKTVRRSLILGKRPSGARASREHAMEQRAHAKN